ncbi:MAG TPA: HD domain-containing phosphohydrolase, partial [Lacipirellulaceae bacterium]|nr:HD domain-containing phosphohydrolase [Lacipirellulaceae bacterium]
MHSRTLALAPIRVSASGPPPEAQCDVDHTAAPLGSMKIKQRRLLMLLLAACQLSCLGFGLVWASRWVQRTFDDILSRNVAVRGRALAHEVAYRIDAESIGGAEPGTEDWNRLQTICEDARAPHDGFVAVIRGDSGALTCHSRLRREPELLRSFPGRLPLVEGQDQVSLIVDAMRSADERQESLLQGRVEWDGVLYETTLLSAPDINAILAVGQSVASIDQAAAELTTPLFQVGLIAAAAVVAATTVLTMLVVSRFESTLTTVNNSLAREVDQRTESLVRTRNAVVFGLAKLSESKDKDTAGHLERVRSYVTFLASHMAKNNGEITHHYVANLAVASALHDIGKVGVPDSVLLKVGRLTPSERRAMQMHAELGGACLAAIQRQLGDDDFLQLGQEVAIAHHEQWDGSGYPLGLQGKEIPLAARIVALADVYDALTSHRPYRPA